MGQVRVVNITRLSPSPADATCRAPLTLSFFDTLWITLPPVQRLFLYRTDRPLPSITEELQASLSRILTQFYSLAGRLTLVPASGDVVISFPGGGDDGIDFLEAEAEGFNFQRLAEDEDHDVEGFMLLVPPLDVQKLPAPVFSVQVTGFAGAGVAVGLSMHHMAADGKALWQFLEAWTADLRRSAAAGEGSGDPEPVLDRSVIRHPKAEEIARFYLRESAPNLPSLPVRNRRQLSRRTFVVSAASIDTLRDRGTSCASRPSAFVALSAHFWLSFIRAKGIPADDQNVSFGFLADCRRQFCPAIDGYFGNCVRPCIAHIKSKELLGSGGGGFRAACSAIRAEIDECMREPLSDWESWNQGWWGPPAERLANVAASPRFQIYEVDFGWGRPTRVELVSMNRDGLVALAAARDEVGAVQVSVALSPLHMDEFTFLFLEGLQQEG